MEDRISEIKAIISLHMNGHEHAVCLAATQNT